MSERPRWDVQGLTTLVMGGVSIVMGSLYLFYIHRKVPETLYDQQCPNRKDYSSPFPGGHVEFGSDDDWLDEAAIAGKFPQPSDDSYQSEPTSSTAVKKPSDKKSLSESSLAESISDGTPPDKVLIGKKSSDKSSPDQLSTGKSSPSRGSPENVNETSPNEQESGSPTTPNGQPSTATSSSTIEDASLPTALK